MRNDKVKEMENIMENHYMMIKQSVGIHDHEKFKRYLENT